MSVALLASVPPVTRLVAEDGKATMLPSLESDGCELAPLGVAAPPDASEMPTAVGTVRSSSRVSLSCGSGLRTPEIVRGRFREPIFHQCKFMPHLSADGNE